MLNFFISLIIFWEFLLTLGIVLATSDIVTSSASTVVRKSINFGMKLLDNQCHNCALHLEWANPFRSVAFWRVLYQA